MKRYTLELFRKTLKLIRYTKRDKRFEVVERENFMCEIKYKMNLKKLMQHRPNEEEVLEKHVRKQVQRLMDKVNICDCNLNFWVWELWQGQNNPWPMGFLLLCPFSITSYFLHNQLLLRLIMSLISGFNAKLKRISIYFFPIYFRLKKILNYYKVEKL